MELGMKLLVTSYTKATPVVFKKESISCKFSVSSGKMSQLFYERSRTDWVKEAWAGVM